MPVVRVLVFTAATLAAAQVMPVAQQNALVQKYCAVCHTDTARNGGLSLQHFDASHAAPSLTAMLLSKLTGGVSLQTAQAAGTSKSAQALVEKNMKSGAMNAAGIPMPDPGTITALIQAFAVQSTGAGEWAVERSGDSSMLTVSTLRESPSKSSPGEAEAYRLIISCDSTTRQGTMQVAWSPVPQSGSLRAAVDGRPAVQFRVEGREQMGNGKGKDLDKLAAVMLTGLPFPSRTLAIQDLFPGEAVTFSFTDLPANARQELAACSYPRL